MSTTMNPCPKCAQAMRKCSTLSPDDHCDACGHVEPWKRDDPRHSELVGKQIEAVRTKLATLTEPCDPKCPGWAVFDSDKYGTILCRCDECWSGHPNELTDDEVEILPEAQEALKLEIARQETT